MKIRINCPNCRDEIEIEDPWEKLIEDEVITCPACGKMAGILEFDEFVESDGGSDYFWFFKELRTK